jgi:hypothetical protein
MSRSGAMLVSANGRPQTLCGAVRKRGARRRAEPGRTPAGGWSAMHGQPGFAGTARELLADLTTDGAAALFVDNLDSFDDGERRTVNDLVREAVGIPGLSVVVTARRNFGVDEPSWLPKSTVNVLGLAPPVVIDDLRRPSARSCNYILGGRRPELC